LSKSLYLETKKENLTYDKTEKNSKFKILPLHLKSKIKEHKVKVINLTKQGENYFHLQDNFVY